MISMRTALRSPALALGLAATVLGVTGCGDFLSGPKLENDDPNNATTASNSALFVASQTNIAGQLESRLARTVCIWMQQCAGQAQYLSLGNYSVAEDDYYINWAHFYGGGGLVDLRTIQSRALADGDSVFWGASAVLEAYVIGTAADLWGDVPYSQAAQPATNPTPVPDPQQQVYAAVQAKLDSAITFLAATGERNVGPGASDLVYGGDAGKWTRLAHTLKARYELHVARRDPTAYNRAAAEAALGLQQGEDYAVGLSGQSATSSNFWNLFQAIFPGYLVAGNFLVSTMQANSDPRLPEYFALNDNGEFAGADPGVSVAPSAVSTLSETRLSPSFVQPFVTWAENQLIWAEAAYLSGDAPTARTKLQEVWAAVGIPTAVPAAGTPGPTDPLLVAIMTEKYIQLFQNVEAWQDWKRTGIPNLTPAPNGTIPRRLGYPLSERNANPNYPQPEPTRNWNDPS
ncbi:MAG TPA: SusD/RagB family nutrient-binding outer membrane lipoprotein [Gemmatimonadales bacterium]|nr:SusD/RagB family nutrient-binding outer membrane lipoprotein [Gemmatimonadales bacterium]